MEEDLIIRTDIVIPGNELDFKASRSGGPGGQHVNKTNSRITLQWSVLETTALDEDQRTRVLHKLQSRLTADGVLQISVDDERSQHQNREIARKRLREIVTAALRVPKKRVATKLSRAAKRRRLEEKKRRGSVKQLRKPPETSD